MTSTVDVKDETRNRAIQKAKVNLFPMAMLMHFFKIIVGAFTYT